MRQNENPLMMPRQICIDDVKYLGGGKFSVRLTAQNAEGGLSQTQTVAAESEDTAIEIAKAAFSRWLDKVAEYTFSSVPPGRRN